MKIIEQSAEVVHADTLGWCESAGRVSHRSQSVDSTEFCTRMLSLGHHSVLEFGSAYVIWVCDRGVSHEVVRHRLASFVQESTRYCNYSAGLTVIEPPGLDDAAKYAYWAGGVERAEQSYKLMRASGCDLDTARAILPTCLATRIHIRANFREWLHIVALRASRHAHPQIRELAISTAQQLDDKIGVDWFMRAAQGRLDV